MSFFNYIMYRELFKPFYLFIVMTKLIYTKTSYLLVFIVSF